MCHPFDDPAWRDAEAAYLTPPEDRPYPPHPRSCRNGWLDIDVACPVCQADREPEDE